MLQCNLFKAKIPLHSKAYAFLKHATEFAYEINLGCVCVCVCLYIIHIYDISLLEKIKLQQRTTKFVSLCNTGLLLMQMKAQQCDDETEYLWSFSEPEMLP